MATTHIALRTDGPDLHINAQDNDTSRKGELAAQPVRFGEHGRYRVAPVHTRFEAVQWFVWDAEVPDQDGRATVIRQADSLEQALKGL